MSNSKMKKLFAGKDTEWDQFWSHAAPSIVFSMDNVVMVKEFENSTEQLEKTYPYMQDSIVKAKSEQAPTYFFKKVYSRLCTESRAKRNTSKSVFWKLDDLYLVKKFFTMGIKLSNPEKIGIFEVGKISLDIYISPNGDFQPNTVPRSLKVQNRFKKINFKNGLFYVPPNTCYIFVSPKINLFRYFTQRLEVALKLNATDISTLIIANDEQSISDTESIGEGPSNLLEITNTSIPSENSNQEINSVQPVDCNAPETILNVPPNLQLQQQQMALSEIVANGTGNSAGHSKNSNQNPVKPLEHNASVTDLKLVPQTPIMQEQQIALSEIGTSGTENSAGNSENSNREIDCAHQMESDIYDTEMNLHTVPQTPPNQYRRKTFLIPTSNPEFFFIHVPKDTFLVSFDGTRIPTISDVFGEPLPIDRSAASSQ